jgi:hypothetical protein
MLQAIVFNIISGGEYGRGNEAGQKAKEVKGEK